MSARVRRSVNSCRRASRSARARRASSATGRRGGAVAHPPQSTSSPRRLLRRLRATLHPARAILEVFDLLLDPLGGRVELQGLLPRGERLGVLGIERDDLPERADGIVELRLLLVDDAELEVEVLVLLVEAQPLLQGLQRAVVLLGAEVCGAKVEEELGPLRLEIDGLAEDRDRLVIALGPPVEEPELDARVDRARVDAEDALELGARLGVLAGVHIRGGEEVSRTEVRRLERDRPPESVSRAVPLLLLVEDRTELHPYARVTRRDLGEGLDLRLRLLEPAEPDQEVAEPLDERRVVRVQLRGAPVDLDGLVGPAARLVDVAEGSPRAVVVGGELDGLLEFDDGLGPRLGLDGEASEQEVRLRQPRAFLDEAEQHAMRPVVRLLLDLVAREREVGLLRVRVQRDDLLQLRLGLGPLLLRAQQLGERRVGRGVVRRELDRASRGVEGLVGRVEPHEPLRERHPEMRRVWIALEGVPEGGDRIVEPTRLRRHLGDGVAVIRLGAPVRSLHGTPQRRAGRRRDRPGGAPGEHRADQEETDSSEQTLDHRPAPRAAAERHAFVSRRRAAAARVGSEIVEVASSTARKSAAPSGADERGSLRGDAAGGTASSVPRVNRSARREGNRSRSRAVDSSARSVISCSHGELSTTTVRQPSTSAWGWARRATSAPTRAL